MTFWSMYKVCSQRPEFFLSSVAQSVQHSSNISKVLPETHKHIRKPTALNAWANLLLNDVHTTCLGDTMSWLHLRPTFSFGWSPDLQVREHPASCDRLLYQQIRHLCCASQNGCQSSTWCSRWILKYKQLLSNILFPLSPKQAHNFPLGEVGRRGRVRTLCQAPSSDSPASTFNPAGIKLL